MKNLLPLSPALLLLPLLALAGENKTELKRKACLLRAVTTQEMRQCEYRAFREANAELLRVQKELVERLRANNLEASKEIEKRLNASAEAWVSHRDSRCLLKSAEVLNGGEESFLLASCTVNMTIERIKELSELKL